MIGIPAVTGKLGDFACFNSWLFPFNQKGFPTLFSSNLPFQRAPFTTALPDPGEQAGAALVAVWCSGVSKQQLGLCWELTPWPECSTVEQRWTAAAGLVLSVLPNPLSLPFLLSQLQHAVCLTCFSVLLWLLLLFFALSHISHPTLFFFSLSVCYPSVCFRNCCCCSPPPAPMEFHPSWALSKTMSSITTTNLVDKFNPWDFFWLLCYRKGHLGHEALRLASCALPEEM